MPEEQVMELELVGGGDGARRGSSGRGRRGAGHGEGGGLGAELLPRGRRPPLPPRSPSSGGGGGPSSELAGRLHGRAGAEGEEAHAGSSAAAEEIAASGICRQREKRRSPGAGFIPFPSLGNGAGLVSSGRNEDVLFLHQFPAMSLCLPTCHPIHCR